MKILTPNQIKEIDEATIKDEPILSIDLMERAAQKFTNAFSTRFDKRHPIHIFCGPGNNGGDGLAIARLLHHQSYHVEVFIVTLDTKYSKDFLINKERLDSLPIQVYKIDKLANLKSIENGIIIDAIFGYGLNKPLKGFVNDVVTFINEQPTKVISVDMPSGLFANQHTNGYAIQSDWVYTFQFPKLAFLLPSNSKYVKNWEVLDINLSTKAIKKQKSEYSFIQIENVNTILKVRERFSHKGTYGHLLLIAGSKGIVGAAILAAKAALRSGIGLLSVFIDQELIPIVQVAIPEAMCLNLSNKEIIQHLENTNYSTLAIGPGLGTTKSTKKLFKSVIKKFNAPIVIDADGLNIISKSPELLNDLPPNSILTPHPGEFKRLVGEWTNDFDKLKLLKDLAIQNSLIIVLKGSYTCICDSNGHLYFNSSGNSGMATAGSGDTLTGIIAGLLSQKYSPLEASILGVYLHGLAGDIAISDFNQRSLIASDITNHLGYAFNQIEKSI